MSKFNLPEPCSLGDHVPAILHRTGGPDAALHNTCGKCGRLILNLADTWILDVYREEEFSAMEGLNVLGYPENPRTEGAKITQPTERQVCSPEHPMPKGAPGRWAHTNVREVGECSAGCCADYRCQDCGHQWREELPQ